MFEHIINNEKRTCKQRPEVPVGNVDECSVLPWCSHGTITCVWVSAVFEQNTRHLVARDTNKRSVTSSSQA